MSLCYGIIASMTLLFGVKAIEAATELAKINSTVITVEDFNKKYQDNLKYFQFKAPSKKSVLDDLIKRELGIQEAKKQGLDKDPEVQDRMNTVLYNALLEKKLGKDIEKIHISDDDARAFYNKNPEIRTSHIFVAVRPDATQEQDKAAQEKIRRLQQELNKGGTSFAELAQRESEGVNAPTGGDLDYQTRDRLDGAYYDAALKLGTPGKVSGIVRSAFGYHIIKLTAIRPWERRGSEMGVDKALVKRALFEQRREQLFEKYMGQLKSQAKVSVKPDLIKD